MNDKYLTVTALNKYIKYKFDNDDNLVNVFIRGEISNLKMHTNGHAYFTLKDESSRINAVMFKSQINNVSFKMEDGQNVLIVGRVSIYESSGSYQIYVDEILLDGIGLLFEKYERLKEKLSEEGLFDLAHKKRIPFAPTKIGIITAPTGAAVRDILTTLNRRYKNAQTILFPSLVQGESAKDDIVKNIRLANTYDLDLIILGRGGGSIEDLWAFNEEIVARAIYESNVPIISAVGHEIDFTISDFVADLRAPTPTAAAELAVPNLNDINSKINMYKNSLNNIISNKFKNLKLSYQKIVDSYILKNPLSIYQNKQLQLDFLYERASININNYINTKNIKFNNLIDKIDLLNPLNTLKRGYTITKQDNKVITSIGNVKLKENIEITFVDGRIIALVEEKNEKN
jgi:exodeoxyribonuclease VII large subunit